MDWWRNWLQSEAWPAAAAGSLLGSVLGLTFGLSVLRGGYDPWLASRRLAPAYPALEAAAWALAFVALSGLIAVCRAALDRFVRVGGGVHGMLMYGVAAAVGAVVLIQPERHEALLRAVPGGLMGAGIAAALALALATRLRPKSLGGRRQAILGLWGPGAVAAASVLTLAVAARLAAGPAAAAGDSGGRPNILLVTIDALRADAVGFASADAPSTPSLDELARRGVVWKTAFVQAPWTLPSVASMLTSRYPSEVGVELRDETSGNAYPMTSDPSVPTLAEVLAGSGYATVAQVTNPFVTDTYGTLRGFATKRHSQAARAYLQRPVMTLRRLWDRQAGHEAEGVSRGAINWLREDLREPFFMWVHYLDPHEPYTLSGLGGGGHRRHDGLTAAARSKEDTKARADARRELRDLYNSEITYCDHWVGQLLQTLREMELEDHALIVVTADHGEAFWEHGGRGHGPTMQDEVLRVPLLTVFPDGTGAGRAFDAPVRLIDVMPTVLEIAGAQIPMGIRGKSLLELPRTGGTEAEPRELLSECRMQLSERKAIRGRRQVVVYWPSKNVFESLPAEEIWPAGDGRGDSGEAELRRRLLSVSEEMSRGAAEGRLVGRPFRMSNARSSKAWDICSALAFDPLRTARPRGQGCRPRARGRALRGRRPSRPPPQRPGEIRRDRLEANEAVVSCRERALCDAYFR